MNNTFNNHCHLLILSCMRWGKSSVTWFIHFHFSWCKFWELKAGLLNFVNIICNIVHYSISLEESKDLLDTMLLSVLLWFATLVHVWNFREGFCLCWMITLCIYGRLYRRVCALTWRRCAASASLAGLASRAPGNASTQPLSFPIS